MRDSRQAGSLIAVRPQNESARPEVQLRTGSHPPRGTSMSNDDSMTPATADDLRWWLDRAPALTWRWATTYAATAPHWYVRGGTTPGFTTADSVRVGRVVRTYGEPGRFWAVTNLYLYDEARARRMWCQFGDPPKPARVRIVNLAMADQVYGEQANFDEQRLAVLRLGGAR